MWVKLVNVRWLCVVELAILSELKVASLESQKKEAKQGYQEYLQAYVTSYLGQPLEKVHVSAKFILCVGYGYLIAVIKLGTFTVTVDF